MAPAAMPSQVQFQDLLLVLKPQSQALLPSSPSRAGPQVLPQDQEAQAQAAQAQVPSTQEEAGASRHLPSSGSSRW